MAITKKEIKDLIGGVSQQPDQLRLPNQCSEQINFLSDPIDGLTRRPGTEFVGAITSAANGFDAQDTNNTFTHVIDQSPTQKYLLVIGEAGGSASTIHLWNMLTGVEMLIRDSGGTVLSGKSHAYLNYTASADDLTHPFAAVTISDHTFVLNKSLAAQMLSTSQTHNTGNYNKSALARGAVFVKSGAYNTEYTVVATDQNGHTRTIKLKSGSGTTTDTEYDIKTDTIAAMIHAGLTQAESGTGVTNIVVPTGHTWNTVVGNGSAAGTNATLQNSNGAWNDSSAPQFVFENNGSTVSWYSENLSSVADADRKMKLVVTDGYGDTLLSSFDEEKTDFAGLPVSFVNNYHLKITGSPESDVDDYYVNFVLDDENATVNAYGNGKWVETTAIGEFDQFNDATMPHQLVKENTTDGNGNPHFKFVAADWADKAVGDSTNDPRPGFVLNGGLQDIFYFKGRLGVLAGENVIMSELNEPYNFWRTTTTQLLATDRIDMQSSVNEVTALKYAVPFANQLVVFSERTQFIINHGSGGLSPQTASLALISRYESSPDVKPVSTNNGIIFAQNKTGASAVYEMYPTGTTETSFEAKDITENLSQYIAGSITNIRSSSLANTVLVQTSTEDNILYAYKYYDRGRERVQSAWSTFKFASDYLRSFHVIGETLHLVEATRPSGVSTSEGSRHVFTKVGMDNTGSRVAAIDSSVARSESAGTIANHTGVYSEITLPWEMRNNAGGIQSELVIINNQVGHADFGKTYTNIYTVTSNYDKARTSEDLVGIEILVGLRYTSSYEFSDQYVQTSRTPGRYKALTAGRTTVKWCEVYLDDSDYLKATVSFSSAAGRVTTSKEFLGAEAYGGSLNDRDSERGALRFAVASRNNRVTVTLSSDTHHLATISGATFELLYTSRSGRVS